MRKHSKLLLGAAFLILGVCFLLAMSCSWNITTKGEILKAEDAIEQEIVQAPVELAESIELLEELDSDPDSIWFKLKSIIEIGEVEYFFVEMEVGELEIGEGEAPDTITVDHRP